MEWHQGGSGRRVERLVPKMEAQTLAIYEAIAAGYRHNTRWAQRPGVAVLGRDLFGIIQYGRPTLVQKCNLRAKNNYCLAQIDESAAPTRYGAIRQEHEWVKVHLMCGVKTHIVTSVEIKDKDASDTKLLPALVDATAKNFQLNEVSADKGYRRARPFCKLRLSCQIWSTRCSQIINALTVEQSSS
jgi:hypothetical protein